MSLNEDLEILPGANEIVKKSPRQSPTAKQSNKFFPGAFRKTNESQTNLNLNSNSFLEKDLRISTNNLNIG